MFDFIGVAYGSYPIPEEVTVDLSGLVDLTIIILGVMAVVWVARKMIKTGNRS